MEMLMRIKTKRAVVERIGSRLGFLSFRERERAPSL